MTVKIFVDTNILVYARDSTEPAKQSVAEQWLRQLWHEQSGRTSTQVLSEYYNTVTRKLEPGLDADAAWQDVQALFTWKPQSMDKEVLSRAREIEQRSNLSWWDSMIVSAAQIQGCAILLTEDLQAGTSFDATTIVNPFSTSIAEARAAYAAVMPKPKSRHRTRGRPSLAPT